jgi:hypothetical protein
LLEILQLGILGQLTVDALQNRAVASQRSCSKGSKITQIAERHAELVVAKDKDVSRSQCLTVLVDVDKVRVVKHSGGLAAEAVDLGCGGGFRF